MQQCHRVALVHSVFLKLNAFYDIHYHLIVYSDQVNAAFEV